MQGNNQRYRSKFIYFAYGNTIVPTPFFKKRSCCFSSDCFCTFFCMWILVPTKHCLDSCYFIGSNPLTLFFFPPSCFGYTDHSYFYVNFRMRSLISTKIFNSIINDFFETFSLNSYQYIEIQLIFIAV